MAQLAASILTSCDVAHGAVSRDDHGKSDIGREWRSGPDCQALAFTLECQVGLRGLCGLEDGLCSKPFVAADELRAAIHDHLRRVDAFECEPAGVILLPA